MPRIAFFEKQEPVEVKEAGTLVCQCGLSKKFPFCDTSHQRTKDEDAMKVYQYIDGKPVIIGELKGCGCNECDCDNEETGGCGCDHEDKEK